VSTIIYIGSSMKKPLKRTIQILVTLIFYILICYVLPFYVVIPHKNWFVVPIILHLLPIISYFVIDAIVNNQD